MINWQGFRINYRLWQRRCLYPLISVIVGLSVCLSTPLPSKAIDLLPLLFQGVQILNLSNISDRQEVNLGQQMNQQLQQEVKISDNSELNDYINEVGRRLAANSDRPNIPYTFQVVEDAAVNAFATTGGFIYVNTGLLKAADNEAELASVLAHEMGHIEGKHLIKQIRQQAITTGVATIAGLDKNKAVGIGVQLALNLPRSRKDEFDADKRGLANITRTGYAQSAMISFMKKLQSSSSVPAFLSTHPAASERVISLQRQINNQPTNQNNGLDNLAYQSKIRAFLQ
ncbi:M48 family metallopeptidase [Dolichospermum circinale]|uniref:M48 family metallopeptidase n=1 Tax=Dolichospermum circinale TaxID=109265 RepID=UPI00040B7664|nr:M48 family metallopeptidase [Dolichospermum circinale]MDB9473744.1 M48 family metallopeptidase [Dolichospermum circinale CS-537/11]MDB9479253.1 M48 family metallopeptidase [Dolichospermum circinale CS-537/03]MDB9481457.1 M48 family metallopeptidase [Dolichospermum circinale CS-537/05]